MRLPVLAQVESGVKCTARYETDRRPDNSTWNWVHKTCACDGFGTQNAMYLDKKPMLEFIKSLFSLEFEEHRLPVKTGNRQ